MSWGAVSVINAMPGGVGATIGTKLTTRSDFVPGGDGRVVNIVNDPKESTILAELCVSAAYNAAGAEEPDSWHLSTFSEMPPSKGLKSSSSACNSVIYAVFGELGFVTDPLTVIKIGVECARRAKVTRTGSFDDACGCHYGGFVMTDNYTDSIIFLEDIPKYDVVLHIPDLKIRKEAIDLGPLKKAALAQREAIALAKTDPMAAMTLNGRIIAEASGLDNSIAEMSLKAGALGAGISGSGPSTAIMLKHGTAKVFLKDTGLEDVIVTETRRLNEI
ncbi:MAG: shikimate kinase [Candidatus Methanomethylophilaceae archaeon]|nr:shikimate kinase [Candidatus Methanomethylophilaceae archaeon]